MGNRKMLIKTLVPVLIIAVIGGMWWLKNHPKDSEGSAIDQSEAIMGELPEHLQDADFSLAITEAVDFEAMSSFGLPIIVDYGADSCIPCKEMAPVLEKLNAEMYGKAFIKFADVWQYAEAASNVAIQVIPTKVLVNADGTPFLPSEELASQIEFLMYSDRETDEHIFTVHQGGLTEDQMRLILAEIGVESLD